MNKIPLSCIFCPHNFVKKALFRGAPRLSYLSDEALRDKGDTSRNTCFAGKNSWAKFMHDQNLARWIVDQAEIISDDYVVEIGPGLGALTKFPLEKAAHVLAMKKTPASRISYANVSIIRDLKS